MLGETETSTQSRCMKNTSLKPPRASSTRGIMSADLGAPQAAGTNHHRSVAQLVERWSPKPYVEGSSPFAPAIKRICL